MSLSSTNRDPAPALHTSGTGWALLNSRVGTDSYVPSDMCSCLLRTWASLPQQQQVEITRSRPVLLLGVVGASNLLPSRARASGRRDPYVSVVPVNRAGAEIRAEARTSQTIAGTTSPQWDELMMLGLVEDLNAMAAVRIKVKDFTKASIGNEHHWLGEVLLPMDKLRTSWQQHMASPRAKHQPFVYVPAACAVCQQRYSTLAVLRALAAMAGAACATPPAALHTLCLPRYSPPREMQVAIESRIKLDADSMKQLLESSSLSASSAEAMHLARSRKFSTARHNSDAVAAGKCQKRPAQGQLSLCVAWFEPLKPMAPRNIALALKLHPGSCENDMLYMCADAVDVHGRVVHAPLAVNAQLAATGPHATSQRPDAVLALAEWPPGAGRAWADDQRGRASTWRGAEASTSASGPGHTSPTVLGRAGPSVSSPAGEALEDGAPAALSSLQKLRRERQRAVAGLHTPWYSVDGATASVPRLHDTPWAAQHASSRQHGVPSWAPALHATDGSSCVAVSAVQQRSSSLYSRAVSQRFARTSSLPSTAAGSPVVAQGNADPESQAMAEAAGPVLVRAMHVLGTAQSARVLGVRVSEAAGVQIRVMARRKLRTDALVGRTVLYWSQLHWASGTDEAGKPVSIAHVAATQRASPSNAVVVTTRYQAVAVPSAGFACKLDDDAGAPGTAMLSAFQLWRLATLPNGKLGMLRRVLQNTANYLSTPGMRSKLLVQAPVGGDGSNTKLQQRVPKWFVADDVPDLPAQTDDACPCVSLVAVAFGPHSLGASVSRAAAVHAAASASSFSPASTLDGPAIARLLGPQAGSLTDAELAADASAGQMTSMLGASTSTAASSGPAAAAAATAAASAGTLPTLYEAAAPVDSGAAAVPGPTQRRASQERRSTKDSNQSSVSQPSTVESHRTASTPSSSATLASPVGVAPHQSQRSSSEAHKSRATDARPPGLAASPVRPAALNQPGAGSKAIASKSIGHPAPPGAPKGSTTAMQAARPRPAVPARPAMPPPPGSAAPAPAASQPKLISVMVAGGAGVRPLRAGAGSKPPGTPPRQVDKKQPPARPKVRGEAGAPQAVESSRRLSRRDTVVYRKRDGTIASKQPPPAPELACAAAVQPKPAPQVGIVAAYNFDRSETVDVRGGHNPLRGIKPPAARTGISAAPPPLRAVAPVSRDQHLLTTAQQYGRAGAAPKLRRSKP